MTALLSFKLLIPLCLLAAGVALLQYSTHKPKPTPPLNARQATMLDSLKTVGPSSHHELK